jgi:nucleotide-binding universal stress UspA family protein
MAGASTPIGQEPLRSVLVASRAGPGGALIDRVSALPLGEPLCLALLRVAPWFARVRRSLLQRTRARLSADVRCARSRVHVGDVRAVLSTRPAAREIAEEARAMGAELIVMARGEGPRSTRVVRETKLPVLLARRDGARQYRRPLIALDRSRGCMDVLALRVLRLPLPPVAVVHAYDVHTEEVAYPDLSAAATAAYRSMCELHALLELEWQFARARMELAVRGEPWTCRVHQGDPRSVIPRVAGELACDLLVVGTRVRRGLVPALLGDTAADLSRSVACDVLFVPIR